MQQNLNISSESILSNQFQSSIDIDKIIQLTEIGLAQAQLAIDKCVVLLLGPTGSGKSTFGNYMNGRKMHKKVIEKVVSRPNGKQMKVNEEFIAVHEDDTEVFQIGHSKQSHTLQIKAVQLHETSIYILCDFPGFFDNRSIEHEISNSICLKQFLTNCKSVIPVVLINYNDFESERGVSFKKLFDLIVDILKKSDEENFNKFLFLYTHVPSDNNTGHINSHISKEQETLDQEDKLESLQYKLLDNLLDQIDLHKDLLILNPIKTSYNDYISLIGKKVPFQDPSEEFNFSLSYEGNLKVSNYAKDVNNQITTWLMQQQYQNIFNLLQSFKRFTELLGDEYLNQTYEIIIHSIKEQIETSFNKILTDFSDSAQTENFLSKKMIEEMDVFKQNLIIIDMYREDFLSDFEKTTSLLVQQMLGICEGMYQNCIQNFSENIQLTKDNLQKLFQVSEKFSEIIPIYNNCKERLIANTELKYEQFKLEIDQFFKNDDCVYERLKVIEIIENLGTGLQEFQHIENFLKSYYLTDNIKMDQYRKLTCYIQTKCQQLLETVVSIIKKKEESFNKYRSNNCDDVFLDHKEVPQFEMRVLKQLNTNHSFNQHVKVECHYENAKNSIKSFTVEQLKQVQDILDENTQLTCIQPIFVSLDQLRNLDEDVKISTLNEYVLLQEQLNKRIISNRETVEQILDKYYQYEDQDDYADEENNKINLYNQKQDFRKLSQILQFLKNMSWTDGYFKKNVVSTTIKKIEEIILQYMENVIKNCGECVDGNNFKILGQQIIQIDNLKVVQEAISDYKQRREDCINTVSIKIQQKITYIERKFNIINQSKINQKIESDWNTLNTHLTQLRQILELKNVSSIKDQSAQLKDDIQGFLQQYYNENLQFINSNKGLQQIHDLLEKKQLKKQSIFIENIQHITLECQDLFNCFGKNNTLGKAKDCVIAVYESLIQEYEDNIMKQVSPQQQKDEYEIVKQYTNEFKSIKGFQIFFDTFKSIANPQQIIKDKFKSLKQQIRNNEFNYLKDSIVPLLSLQNKEDKAILNDIFIELFCKIKREIDSLIYYAAYHNKPIESEFNQKFRDSLYKINVIKDVCSSDIKQFINNKEYDVEKLCTRLKKQIDDFFQLQTNFINLKAQQLNFQYMEETFNNLNQFVGILDEQQVWDYSLQIQELKLKLEQTIKNLLKDKEVISHSDKLALLITRLKESNNRNNLFSSVYSQVEGRIQESVNQYIESQIQNIMQFLDQDIYQKSKLELQRLKQYLESLKQNHISYDNNLGLRCNDFEEQIYQINLQKMKKIDELLTKGDNENLNEVLRSHKQNDKDLYDKSITLIKNKLQSLVDVTSYQFINIDEREFTQNVQKIFNICQIEKCDLEFSYFKTEQYKILIQKIIQFSEINLSQAKNIVENIQQVQNDFNFIDLFKYKVYLKILRNCFKEENKLKELITLVDEIMNKLFYRLQFLIIDQQNFITSGGQSPNYKELKSKCMNYESLIQFLKQDQINNQLVHPDIINVGKQLETFENLCHKIQEQVIDIEIQMQKAWEQGEFQKVKQLLEELNQKRIVNQSIHSELIDLNKIIKKIEDCIDRLTKDAISKIQSTSKYDGKFNSLIENIYKSEETLHGQNGLQYKTQSQIQLVENEILKKVEEIKNKCKQKYPDSIASVSKILIKIEKIGENVKRFNKIVNKKNDQALQNFYKEFGNVGIFSLAQVLNQSGTGKYIVENYQIFKFYKIDQFNQVQLQHGEGYVFDNLYKAKIGQTLSSTLNSQVILILKEYLHTYNQVYNGLTDKYILQKEESWQELVNDAKQIIAINSVSINNWNEQSKKASIQVLARICAYWSLSEGALRLSNKKDIKEQNIFKKPTVIQIVSILMLLGFDNKDGFLQKVNLRKSPFKNKLIEILTGEGKSLTLGFCSLLLALIGCNVDVVCYSKYLSKRDYEDFQTLFTKFGVQSKVQYQTFMELFERYINQQYGNVRDLTIKSIKNNTVLKKQLDNKHSIKVMLIDEVDVFFDLDYYGQTYNPSTLFNSEDIEQIIRKIWALRNYTQQNIYNEIIQSQQYNRLILNFPNLTEFFKRQINELSICVKLVQQHENEMLYIVKDDKIGYKQKDSTYSYVTSFSYHTLFAYFSKNLSNKQISDESLRNQIGFTIGCGQLSYALLPNQYDNILGVTGTLKDLNPVIIDALQKYNITKKIYAPSMYGASNRKFLEGTMVFVECDCNNQTLKVNSIAQAALLNKQSILVFFKSKKDIDKYLQDNQFIKNIDKQVIQLKEGMDISDIDFYVKKSTESKQITLCVREYGRGTDFVCYDPDVIKNGGVVVVQTFLSANKTEQIQIQGRTARQGNKGEYYLVLSQTDLQDEFNIQKQSINQWKNNQETSCLYNNLIKTREDQQNQKFQSIGNQVDEAKNKHDQTLQFYKDLLIGDKNKVNEYVNQFG